MPDNSSVFSVYVHVGNLLVDENDPNKNIVTRGQQIAEIAAITGLNPHLHFEIRVLSTFPASVWDGDIPGTGYYKYAKMMSYYGYTDPSDFIDNHRGKPINNNLDIYGGTRISPYNNVDFWCYPPNGNSSFSISNFLINGNPKSINIVANSTSFTNGRAFFKLDFSNVFTSSIQNDPYNIEFDIISNGKTTHFFSSKLYFLNINDYQDIDSNSIEYYAQKYIAQGIRNGLFKGSKVSGNWMFYPDNNLTKGQACKIIASMLLRLNVLNGINENTSNGTPSPSSNACSEFFPYLMTLYNKDNSIIPFNSNSDFDVNENINLEEFTWILDKSLSLPLISNVRSAKSKLSYFGTTNQRTESMKKMGNIFIQNKDANGYVNSVESIASLFQYGLSNANAVSNIIPGGTKIKRATMAKILTNLLIFYSNQNNINIYSKGNNSSTSDYFVLGDKYESTDQPIGNIPALSSQIQSSYTINDNQTLTISHNSSTDAANSGIPLYFYWTASGGDTLQALTTDFRSIKFKPDTVTAQTTYKLYTQCGNTNGKIREYFIDVIVNPTNPTSTTTTPTIQATNMQVTGSTYNSINVSWTRGNGSYCLVTACPSSSNVVHPQLNNIYTGNANYNAASVVGNDTKILYSGTGSSLNITGLQANTGYKIFVYEFNGNTTVTVKYLTTPLCFNVAYTQPPINTVAAISYNSPLVSGVAQIFYGGSSLNANTYSWSISPSAAISSTTAMNPYFTFPNTGTYTITLTASNTATGQADTKTVKVNVLNAATNLPDLIVQNLLISPSSVIAGQSVAVTCTVLNTNANVPSIANGFGVKYYISDDQTYDISDYAVGIESLVFTNKFSEIVTHSVTVPNWFSGSKYILAIVDYNNYVAETDETNNISSVSLPIVSAKCDLTITTANISPATIASGISFTVNYTVNNLGQRSNPNNSWVKFYISKDNVFSIDDYDLGAINTTINSQFINPNIPQSFSKTASIPNWWLSGNYYIIVYVDDPSINNPNFQNDETDENNNTYAIAITIANSNQPTVQASNIKITNITSTSVKISWTNGNGNRRLVTGTKGYSGYPNLPVDGVAYTSNTNWNTAGLIYNSSYPGNPDFASRVLFKSTGNSITVTGLSPDTTYYFSVLEYNDLGGGNIDYLQNGNNITHTHTYNNNNGWQTLKDDYRTNYGLHFISADTGFINAPWGVSITYDSGKTWSLNQYITQNNANYLNLTQRQGIKFLSDNHNIGFLAKGGSLFRTTNKGITWKEIILISGKSVYDFFAIDSNTIYFITSTPGNSYELRKTIDGGLNSSILLTSTFFTALNSVYFINKNVGIVASGTGKFYRTIDGGITWSSSDLNNNSQYPECSGLYFNSKYGFYADYYGRIYKTIDTGKTWTLKYDLGTTGILQPTIKFYNNSVGVIALNNKIAKTFDAGETWTIVTNPTNNASYCFADIVNENTIYFSSEGYLSKSSTGGLSNSITITNAPPVNLCPNSSISLNFTKTGIFNANDSVVMEFSDTSGSFISPIILSQVASSANTDSITGNLPSNFLSSTKYKLRLRTLNPGVISNSTSSLQFSTAPVLFFTNLQDNYTTSVTAFTLAATPTGGIFMIDGINSTTFNAATLGVGNHIVTYTYTLNSCTYTIKKTVNVFITKSISLGTLSTTTVCAGASVNISYILAGAFDTTNILTVQLSDNIGTFNSPTILGSFSTNISGNLIVNIPNNISAATSYKLRIANTDTSVISNISNSLAILNAVTPTVSISGSDSVCSGSNLLFTSNGNNLGTTPVYQWYVNGSAVGSGNSIYSNNSLNDGDVVQLKVISNASCVSNPTVFSQYKIITVITSPDTPTIASFDSILVSSSPYNNQWYYNGVIIVGATDQFYVAHQNGLYQVHVKANPCNSKNSILFNYIKQADCSIITGNIISPLKKSIQNVSIKLQGDSNAVFVTSNNYTSSLVISKNYTLRPTKNNDITKANGVTATDVLFVQRHILGTAKLNSAYKIIAADVDGNKQINATDVLRIKRLILGTDTTFKNTTTNELRTWAFVDSSYQFPDTINPFPFKDSISFTNLTSNKTNQTFIGVKLGDVNFDWNPAVAKGKTTGSLELIANSESLNKNTVKLLFTSSNFNNIAALQATLHFDNTKYQFEAIKNNKLNIEYNATKTSKTGNIAILWSDKNGEAINLKGNDVLFELILLSKENGNLDLKLNDEMTNTLAVDEAMNERKITLLKEKLNTIQNLNNVFIYPNPAKTNIIIKGSDISQIKIINQSGLLLIQKNNLNTNQQSINIQQLPKGIYTVTVITKAETTTQKLIVE